MNAKKKLSRQGMCSVCEKSHRNVYYKYLYCSYYNRDCQGLAQNCKGPFVDGVQDINWTSGYRYEK